MTSPPETPREEAKQWLDYARGDLAYARLGLNQTGVQVELATFHLQQAAEKAIKAVLILNEIKFPFVHDLDVLVERVEAAEIERPEILNAIGDLSRFAVEARYPGGAPHVSATEVTRLLSLAEATVFWAATLIEPPASAE